MPGHTSVDHVDCAPPDRCGLWFAGHNVHVIQAGLVAARVWGWRDALVVAVHGQDLTLRYLAEDVQFDAWHHRVLPLQTGTPVRVNENAGCVLHAPFGLVSLAADSPTGPVPDPALPELWAAEYRPLVVDVASGNALDVEDEPER